MLIAKVARLDCPRQWPGADSHFIESVKVQDDLRQHRALLTFYHVTKTLRPKRLSADRKLFYDVGDLMELNLINESGAICIEIIMKTVLLVLKCNFTSRYLTDGLLVLSNRLPKGSY